MFDAVIVGAGPGGLAAAHALCTADPAARVAVVDSGRPHTRRFCPVDYGRRCRGCGGICNVISGFGGSMHYGDGIKLSLLPSGRRLVDLFGDDAYELSEAAFALFSSYLGSEPALVGHDVAPSALDVFERHGLHLRQYPVAVVSESELAEIIERLYDGVSRFAELRLEETVVDVRGSGDGFEVTTKPRRRPARVLRARSVVLATGRAGLTRSQQILRRIGVPMQPPDFSVGVRFEMPGEYLGATGLTHPDMKVSQRRPEAHKVKTFCFCGGTNGGRVKFTNYQDAFGAPIITLDGHESLEREPGQRPLAGNFGLMCQTVTLDDGIDASAYFRANVLEPYRRLNEGRPVVQRFADFRSRRASPPWPEIEPSLLFDPSVTDLASAPLDSLFTDVQLASLVEGFRNVIGPILELGEIGSTLEEVEDDILVIGLELEFLWNRVAVDAHAETPHPSLYVVGDTAGIAQGVIQAAMMGIRAGRRIAARLQGASREAA